jgi:hypothetical protein
MFGKKKKINITDTAVKAQAKRPVMSDIVPAHGHVAMPLTSKHIAVVRAETPKVAKPELMSAPIKIVQKMAPTETLPVTKKLPSVSAPSLIEDRPTHLEPQHGGGKFDFLTHKPIDEGRFPQLPEKPGRLSKLKDKWSEIFSSTSQPEEDEIITEYVVGKNRFKAISLAVVAALILGSGVGFFALRVFSSVSVDVVPREEAIDIDKVFRVAKDGGDLPVEMMTFNQSLEESKDTTGSLDANSRARGRIVIYNAYGVETQVLVKRTRFETPSGKIFRTVEGVVVPGMTVGNGVVTPGSIEVEVTADQPGEDYNVGLSDFTIPGFKGTARFTKFYGRSKTPIAGGSTGSQRVTAKSDVEGLKAVLLPKLEAEINTTYKSKIPEGFILLSDAYSIAYSDARADPPIDAVGDKVAVSLAGDFKGLLMKEESLGDAIAAASGKGDMAKKAHLVNAKDLNMVVVKKDLENGEMTVHVSGKAKFIWNVDVESIKKDFLASKPIVEIFGAYEGVEKADVNFRPSWWHYVPKDGKNINVRVVE